MAFLRPSVGLVLLLSCTEIAHRLVGFELCPEIAYHLVSFRLSPDSTPFS